MILGLAFFKDSVPQRYDFIIFDFFVHMDDGTRGNMSLQLGKLQVQNKRSFQLTEEGVLRASQTDLLIANSTTQLHK